MSQSVSAVVKDAGRSVELHFDACRVFFGGEFAGNIEVDLRCEASAVDCVAEQLSVRLPDGSSCGEAIAAGEYAGGLSLVFASDASTRLPSLPEQLVLLFGETPVATIAATLEDSVPLAQRAVFTEPHEISETFAVPTSKHVLLAESRQGWWYIVSGLLVLGGILGVFAELPRLELLPSWLAPALGVALIAGGFAIVPTLARTPTRQVWLDRDRRRVLLVEGRTRNPQAQLASAPGRSLDDFDHVRVYMRWSLAQDVDSSDQEVWMVTLEAPIPFASSDGTVHLHADSLGLGEYTSGPCALRVAAEVAFHTGLKILDMGHDQTA